MTVNMNVVSGIGKDVPLFEHKSPCMVGTIVASLIRAALELLQGFVHSL